MSLKQEVEVIYYDRDDNELPQGRGNVWITKKPHCLKILLVSDRDSVESFNVSAFKDIPTQTPEGTRELTLSYKNPKTCNKIVIITKSTNKLHQLITMLNSKPPPSSDRRSSRKVVYSSPSDKYFSGIYDLITELPQLKELKRPTLFFIYAYFKIRELNKDSTDGSVFDIASKKRDEYYANTEESKSLRDKKDKSLITAIKNWSARCRIADDAQPPRSSASNSQRHPEDPATISLHEENRDDSMSDYQPPDAIVDTMNDEDLNIDSIDNFLHSKDGSPVIEQELNATETEQPENMRITKSVCYKTRRMGKKYINMDDPHFSQHSLSDDDEVEDEESGNAHDNFSPTDGFAPCLTDIQLPRSRRDTSVSGASVNQLVIAVSKANTVPSSVLNIYDVENIMPGMEASNNCNSVNVLENGFYNNNESQINGLGAENGLESSGLPTSMTVITKAMSQPPNLQHLHGHSKLKKTAKRNAPLPHETPRLKRSCLDPYTDAFNSASGYRRNSGNTFNGEETTTDFGYSQVLLNDPTRHTPSNGISAVSKEGAGTNIATITTTSGVSYPFMEPRDYVQETLSPLSTEQDQLNGNIFNCLAGLSPFPFMQQQQDPWEDVLNDTSMETVERPLSAEETSIPPQERVERENETSQSSEYQMEPYTAEDVFSLNVDFENRASLEVDNNILEQCARSAGIFPEDNETVAPKGRIPLRDDASSPDLGNPKEVTPAEQDRSAGDNAQDMLPVVEDHVPMEVVTTPVINEVPVSITPSASPDIEHDENDAVVPAAPSAEAAVVPEIAALPFAPNEETVVNQRNQENVQDGGEDIWAVGIYDGRDMLTDLIDDGIYVNNLAEKRLLRQFKMNIDLALDNIFLIIASTKEREMSANEIGSALEDKFRDEIEALPFKYDNLPEGGFTRRLLRMTQLFTKYFGKAHPINQCPICVQSNGSKVPFSDDDARKTHLLSKDHMKVVRRLSRHYKGTDKIEQFTLDYPRMKLVKKVVEDISFPTEAAISAKISTKLGVNMEVLLELIDRVKQGVLRPQSSQLFSAVEHCKVCNVTVVNKEEHVLSPEHLHSLDNEDYIEFVEEVPPLVEIKKEPCEEGVKKEEPVDQGYGEGPNAPALIDLENNDSGITEPDVQFD